MFKIYLDNQPLDDEPLGVDEFEAQMSRSFNRKDIITTFPSQLIFIGDGYRYIQAQKKEFGYCHLIDFKAEYICGDKVMRTFNGTVFITDCVFDLEKCFCEVEVKDDNFAARINNNRSVEVNIGSWNTKSGDFLQGATLLFLNLFRPSTGNFDNGTGSAGFANSGLRVSYDWLIAIEHILRYISDNAITGVKSDWYNGLSAGSRWAVVDGEEMRRGSAVDLRPNITFDDIWEEMAVKYNLWMSIEIDSNGDAYVRIEQEEYYFNTSSLFTVDNIKNVKESFLQAQLYSSLRFGDSNGKKMLAPDADEFGFVTFFNTIKEQYHTDNQCNIDSTLDLTSKDMVYDHNEIKAALMDDDDANDDKNFLIQYNHTNDKASNGDPLNAGQRIYNTEILNNKVAERYDLQGAVAKFIGTNDDSFEAHKTLDKVTNITFPPASGVNTISISEFNTIITNPNGNYSAATDRYTAPIGGPYGFHVSQNYYAEFATFNTSNFTRMTVKFERYDVGNTLIDTHPIVGPKIFGNITGPSQNVQGDFFTYMAVGDYVRIKVELSYTFAGPSMKWTLLKDAVFSGLSTFNGGGIYEEKEPDDYKVSIFEFEKYLTGEQQNQLLDNPHRPVTFNMNDGNDIKGWVLENNMQFEDGRTFFKVINSRNAAN